MVITLLGASYYNLIVTKHLISGVFVNLEYLPLSLYLLSLIFLLILMIGISHRVATTVLGHITEKNESWEVINRISGDIQAIDRNTAINSHQMVQTIITIMAAYLFSILSLSHSSLQLVLFLFLLAGALLAFRFNRRAMKLRR